MSASEYRKRKRKKQRERKRDEVRLIRLIFADFINNGHDSEWFPIREYFTLTRQNRSRYETSPSRYMDAKDQTLLVDSVSRLRLAQ
ncbi:MAG: hypothetical protein ACE5H4_05140 [Candidatus Thorarchaeota archaeon]